MNVIKKIVATVTKGVDYIKALMNKALDSKKAEKVVIAIAKFAQKTDEAMSPLPRTQIWAVVRYVLENAASIGTWGVITAFSKGVRIQLTKIPLLDKLFKMAVTLAFSWLGQLKAEAGMKSFLDNVEYVYNQWADALGITTKRTVTTTARAPRKNTTRKNTSR